ncbi:N,N-dimethylformamidase beta subunit family domain-containing protein [Agromyces sp. M3QZ16-3]|uniref:N,N-dimethylformamidase beta subunit family domain-containing protein n=1 Tax=Agromyces sp. M3QZ16-3 TaxID=3447585 RepID=UPI003F68C688
MRTVLVLLAVLLTAAVSGPLPEPRAAFAQPAGVATAVNAAVPPPVNEVVLENRLGGDSSWRIPWAGYSLATDTDLAVKGYASAVSVEQGESVGLHVHVASAGSTRYDVYRLGWYQGIGGRRITGGTFNATPQPACGTLMPEGTITCDWARSVELHTSEAWASGVYVVVLTRGTKQNYASFVVRDGDRTGALVHLQPTFTYQAYNNFPADGRTGKSLYSFNSFGATTIAGDTSGVKASFDRPYANAGAALIVAEEAPMIRYAESRGFDVTYATDLDLHLDPGLLGGQEGMLSVGHDEYWTGEMFTAAERARDAGVDLGYLGANNMYWQVRLEPSETTEVADRVLVCYRSAELDPVKDETRTVMFRELPRPEQPVVGQAFPNIDGTGLVGSDAAWRVRQSDHWMYRGTGLRDGSTIPGLVGIEIDRRLPQQPAPTVLDGTSLAVLAQSPFVARNGLQGIQESTLYQAPSSARVFSAGTLNWTQGLMGGDITPQQSVRTMTTNLLARFTGMRVDASTERVGGSDRYGTAVALSKHGFPAGDVPVAFLATGANFPDALAAAAATGGAGPVLLVPGQTIPQAVLDELARLRPASLVVSGGPSVVSNDVLDRASEAAGVAAVRASGADRYVTAADVSERTFAPGVPVAYVAAGTDFPDALSAGTAAAQLGGPVLLTAPNALPDATLAELDRLDPQRIVVVGGTGAVSEGVRSRLTPLAPQVTRLGGVNRYETAMLVARDLAGPAFADTVGLATALSFPDALAAGPVVAASGGSLLLVGGSVTPELAEELVRSDPRVVLLSGLQGAIPDSVAQQVAALFAPDATPFEAPVARRAQPNDPTVPDTGPDTEYADPSLRPELPWLDDPPAEWQYVPGSAG